jgi:glycosyltransferase involved in cell wall biosynthesis
MKALKVIIFHQEFYFSGGAEHTLFDVIDHLREENFDVTCYAPYVNLNTCFPDRIRSYPIQSLFPRFITTIPLPRELYIIIAAILSPLLLLRFKQADLFYGANQSGPLFAYVAHLIHRKPYIIYSPYPANFLYPRQIDLEFNNKSDFSTIGKTVLRLVKPLYQYLDKIIYKNASAVCSEGEYAVSIFQRIYQRTIVNCPAGVKPLADEKLKTTNRFSGEIKIGSLKIEKPFILLTNRHVPKKKFEYALEVLVHINNYSHIKPLLVITGKQTEYTDTLQQIIRQKLLTAQVTFTNLLSEKDMQNLYLNAAVYIYTAPEEDYGKGIIHALANGVPAIAWDNAGPGKIIKNNQTGFLVPRYDIKLFAEYTTKLLSDQEINQQISQQAHKDAKLNFSIDKHKNVLVTLIKQVINDY